MYCIKCGKQIGDSGMMCEECLQNDLIFGEEESKTAQPVQPVQHTENAAVNRESEKENRMFGFKPALLSTILGTLGVVFIFVAWGCAYILMFNDSYAALRAYRPALILSWIMFVFSLPCMVVALVYGVKTLKSVIRVKKEGGVLPIPALVLSISAVVMAAVTATFVLVTAFFLMHVVHIM